MSQEMIRWSLAELAAQIQSKSVSLVEVTDLLLEEIDAQNGTLNAFITVTADLARQQARAAEHEIFGQGHYRGPLHGVPIAHKDLYFTKGIRTTAGSNLMKDFVPDEDATVVRKLAEAGAILLGKTQTHEFAYGPTSEISAFGPARNPWNPERITGGSSGGSAAAVRAGLCFGATGTDTGGSIRMPAAACGIVGLKPTYGLCSRHGIFPLCWSMDHSGPMTRTVEDAAIMLQAMAGYDEADPASAKVEVPDYRAQLTGDLHGLRIGLPTEYFFGWGLPEVDAAVRRAVGTLEELGARVVEIDLPNIHQAAAAALTMYLAEASAYHEPFIEAGRGGEYQEMTRTFIELGGYVLAKDYLNAQRYRRLLREHDFKRAFERVDVIVTPTLPITATPIGTASVPIGDREEAVFGAMLRFTEPFSLTKPGRRKPRASALRIR
ncbi:MAG TPA: amidase, partial [Bacillota bacterium]